MCIRAPTLHNRQYINTISNILNVYLYTMASDDDDTRDREERLKTLKCYPCDICKKKFYRWGNLKRHVALHERGFNRYHCDDPKPHPSSAALAEHISRRHSSDTVGGGVKPSAIIDPEWKIVKAHQTSSKRFQKSSYDVELQHVEHVEPSFEHFDKTFSCLLEQAAISHTCMHTPHATPL